jgi:hypothetical protein
MQRTCRAGSRFRVSAEVSDECLQFTCKLSALLTEFIENRFYIASLNAFCRLFKAFLSVLTSFN